MSCCIQRGLRPIVVAIVAAHAFALGCGGGNAHRRADPADYEALVQPGTREPASELEREILAGLDGLAPGAEARLNGSVVVAGETYTAASGRTCRKVSVRSAKDGSPAPYRLLCKVGDAWSFMPDVLRSPVSPGGAK